MMESALTASTLEGKADGAKLLRLPKKSIQNEYLINILLAMRDMDAIIKDLTRLDDPRPQLMARQIVNRILDDDIKYSLLDKFDELLDNVSKSTENADVKGLDAIKVSQDVVGEVNSYLDEYFAIHKGQEIGDV